MEHRLSQLFDRQKFQNNARLAAIISDVDTRYANVLLDDDLDMVHAAGITEPIKDASMPIIPCEPPEENKP